MSAIGDAKVDEVDVVVKSLTVTKDILSSLQTLGEELEKAGKPGAANYKDILGRLEALESSDDDDSDLGSAAKSLFESGMKVKNALDSGDGVTAAEGVLELMGVGCTFFAPELSPFAGCLLALFSTVTGAFCNSDSGQVSIESVIQDAIAKLTDVIEDTVYKAELRTVKADVMESMKQFDMWANTLALIETRDAMGAASYQSLWDDFKHLVMNATFAGVESHIEDLSFEKTEMRVPFMILFAKLSMSKLMNVIRMRFLVQKHKPAIDALVLEQNMVVMDTAIRALMDSGKKVLGFMAPKMCTAKDVVTVAKAMLKVQSDYSQIRGFLCALGLENTDLHTPGEDVMGSFRFFGTEEAWLQFDNELPKSGPSDKRCDKTVVVVKSVEGLPRTL